MADTPAGAAEARPVAPRPSAPERPVGILSRIWLRLRSVLFSYRLRLLLWFVVLLGLGTAATVTVVGQLLLQLTEDRIRGDLVQESEEFRQLAGGTDPETGEPFGSDVRRIFDVFLDRNVPARYEVILTFVDRQLYRSSVPAPRHELGQDPVFISATSTVMSPTAGSVPSSEGQVDYLAVPVIVDGETLGVFVVAAFRDLERAERDDILRAVATVGVAVLIIGTILAWRLADRVLAPVRRTAATARSISETDLTKRVEVVGDDEVAELAQTFNEMLDRISAAFEEQRRFMDDAGHELRTPLTIAQGHLELLDEGTLEERKQTLALVLDEVERMTRLVNDLVLLAAATRPDFARRSEIDVAELASTVHAKARVLGDRDWRLEIGRPGRLLGDRQRLTQAVLQLVENAIRHTSEGDTVAIGADGDDVGARIWVRDTGAGIAEHDQRAIFDRFYRGPGGRPGRAGGTGLGLSIVRAIVEAHAGTIAVASRPGEGATFTMSFPRRERRG